MKRLRRFSLTIVALLSLTAAVTLRAQIPQSFKNLQVLPKDIARADLVAMMKGFTQALGVRCEHCHVGEGNDLAKFDFVADTRPTKETARKMIRMATTLNEQIVALNIPAAEGAPAPTGPKLTCFTCHRGAKKPLTAPGGGG